MSAQAPRSRPLLVRAGARFTCHGDGVCCHDVHLLGPVARREIGPLTTLRPDVVDRRLGLPLLRTDAVGHCQMLDARGRCSVHAESKRPYAPRSCRRFPFLLVATPDGGRIGTDHRCPCRTMGVRAALDPEEVTPSIEDASARLSVDRRVGPRVALTARRRVGWSRWCAIEDEVIARIASAGLEAALEVQPFPALDAMSWASVAADVGAEVPDTRWGWALRWFGAHLGAAREGVPGDVYPRPWREAFDRAEARTPVPEDPERMLADFVADQIWSMEWATRGTWLHARLEMRTALEVTRSVARTLVGRGVRPDRAMGEAILVAEVGAVSAAWTSVVQRFVVPKS